MSDRVHSHAEGDGEAMVTLPAECPKPPHHYELLLQPPGPPECVDLSVPQPPPSTCGPAMHCSTFEGSPTGLRYPLKSAHPQNCPIFGGMDVN